MKRLSFILVLCALVPFLMGVSPFVRHDGEPQVQGPARFYEPIYNFKDFFDQAVTTETKAAVTLYVDAAGSDVNDCLTVGTACLTIQEAVDRIPRLIRHDVTVNIGEGNFAGFEVTGFVVKNPAAFEIKGTLGNFFPATGNQTGTATGGSTTQCVDVAGGWTVNDLRGTLILVNGEYRVVRNNDATTINLVGALSATCNGKVYSVEEQKTVINSAPPEYPNGRIYVSGIVSWRRNYFTISDLQTTPSAFPLMYYSVMEGTLTRMRINGNAGSVTLFGVAYSGRVDINDCYTNNASNGYGFNMITNQTNYLTRLYDYGSKYGVMLQGTAMTISSYLTADNAVSLGIGAYDCANVALTSIGVADSNIGFQTERTSIVHFTNGTIDNSTNEGMVISTNKVAYFTGTATVSNSGADGIEIRSKTFVDLNGTLVGAGNTGHGMLVRHDSYIFLNNGNTTITGTIGDVSVNDGTTTTTWAFFDENGDFVVNTTNGATIERNNTLH